MIAGITSLLLPVLVPGIVLIAALRLGWLQRLRMPIDRGVRLRGAPLLGETKTWLGVSLYVLGGAVTAAIVGIGSWGDAVYERVPGVVVGLVVGSAYALGELANSFVKRRIGIASSASARGRGAATLQRIVDLVDGAVVACCAYLLLGVDPITVLAVLVCGVLLHLVAEWIQSAIGLRR